ncbi:hypothetical protein D8B26_003214 [Coccidioides posadasii str. Silveira]|uniref:Uncharacterized protein n=1 Tax=Coccidioides posadasii (strain RMSCC 757 / Silveira) TaxID=443226 RepID=E9D0E5_COCPS|nr:conserved hypothetical protein [Coccidioides posadasii str. Silveira]QVM08525.1 hypothetical protein D8B26_003214 [Coccidioides posadasii str. Silveira]
MAETAANNSADALSSPGSVKESQRPWDQSPSNGQDSTNPAPSKPRTSHDSTAPHPKYNSKNSISEAVNGTPVSGTLSRSGSRQGHLQDQGYLATHRGDTSSRMDTGLGPGGSDSDSLLDLYEQDPANRSSSSIMDSTDPKPDKGGYYRPQEPDDSHWIHRDKLAKIESEELQQFGIQAQDPVLMRHRSDSKRGRSYESQSIGTNGSVEPNESFPIIHEDKRQRLASPIPIDDGPQDEDVGPAVFEDPRLPEEIAADPYEDGGSASSSRVYRMPGLRKSSSRIPVLASSPHPIPHEYLGRDSPLPRTRNNTVTSGDEDTLSFSKTRRPSESAPRVLQTPEPQIETTPPQSSQPSTASRQLQNSPSKAKHSAKSTPATSRKASGTQDTRKSSGTHKKAAASNGNGSIQNQRPGTRSGERRPPTGLNRPEGDPPWLATMYKPDPRLPPDQQMLPTHAKRLQQELWEKEGRIPSTYDKDFAPLAIRRDEKPPSPVAEPELPKEEDPCPIVFAPPSLPSLPSPPKSPEMRDHPGKGDTDRSGYKSIPSLIPSATEPTFTTSISAKPGPSPMQEQPPPKKKSCSCCIVM